MCIYKYIYNRVDNSEWMRNGDYTPNRLVAQNEAVNLVFNAKTQSNPENTVGLMTMAGKSPEVLVTLTSDIGKILSALHGVKPNGKSDFLTSVQIAQVSTLYRYIYIYLSIKIKSIFTFWYFDA